MLILTNTAQVLNSSTNDDRGCVVETRRVAGAPVKRRLR